MATKIFYNGNRIIIDGHADTAEECRAITAMCDSMAADENFKTIVYEKGHAVFEQVSGGESEMFQSLQEQLDALEAYVKTINSCKCDAEVMANGILENVAEHYVPIEHFNTVVDALQQTITTLRNLIGTFPEDTEATTLVEYVDKKTNVPKYKLSLSASEIEAALK